MTGSLAGRRRLAALILLIGTVLAGDVRLRASDLFTDAPVPGGFAALAKALDIPELLDRDRAIVELARLLYDSETGRNPEADGRLARLAEHFGGLTTSRMAVVASHPVSLDIPPDDTVLMPLTPAIWSTAIFRRPILAGTLVATVLMDRRAALLAHGLLAVDDETLAFLAANPILLGRLYERAGVFSVFGEALRIDNGRVVVPGGSPAEDLWAGAVGARPDEPVRFVRALFDRRGGRVAYLYHALSHLDQARTAFALGLWIDDGELRRDRFQELVGSLDEFPGLAMALRPFSRPGEDIVTLLARLHVRADGAPAPPEWRRVWRRVFAGFDVPDDRGRLAKDIERDGVIDAAWLSQGLGTIDFRFRAERLDQIAFGQRVFSEADSQALPDVIAALRSFPVTRMLMLTLERAGIRTPSLYAAAARRAANLSSLDPDRAFAGLSQFQGAAALVERLVRVHSIDSRAAESLFGALVSLPLGDGRYAGGVTRWTRDVLGPAIGMRAETDIDAALVRALAGPVAGRDAARVTWEDQPYRVDFAVPERRRLTRALQATENVPGSQIIAVVQIADRLRSTDRTMADVRSAIAALDDIGRFLQSTNGQNGRSARLPPGVSAPSDHRATVRRAVDELSRITAPRDLQGSANVAEPLLDMADDLLANAFRTLIYALSEGDDDPQSLRLATVSGRHDFGLDAIRSEVRARIPWSEPSESVSVGVPWHVSGSLLGLDQGLSVQALRTVDLPGPPAAPVLNSNESRSFSRTVVLLSPQDLHERDLDVLLDAISRGRRRVSSVSGPGQLNAIAAEIKVDGWRRRLMQQQLAHDPDRMASYLSMTELLMLGHPGPFPAGDAWGVASGDYDGCPCTRLVPPAAWSVFIGRGRTGVMSAQVADLNLRVAEQLRQLGLPGSLLKDVLAVATRDFVDRVKPLHAYDWLTLVQDAQTISIDRVSEIVASLTAFGPLVPDEMPPSREDRP